MCVKAYRGFESHPVRWKPHIDSRRVRFLHCDFFRSCRSSSPNSVATESLPFGWVVHAGMEVLDCAPSGDSNGADGVLQRDRATVGRLQVTEAATALRRFSSMIPDAGRGSCRLLRVAARQSN